MNLMKPSCPMGYTKEDLDKIFGPSVGEFYHWMGGQTTAVCDGSKYSHETGEFTTTECSGMLPGMPVKLEEIPYLNLGHGDIFYPWDVKRYMQGYGVDDLCSAGRAGRTILRWNTSSVMTRARIAEMTNPGAPARRGTQ